MIDGDGFFTVRIWCDEQFVLTVKRGRVKKVRCLDNGREHHLQTWWKGSRIRQVKRVILHDGYGFTGPVREDPCRFDEGDPQDRSYPLFRSSLDVAMKEAAEAGFPNEEPRDLIPPDDTTTRACSECDGQGGFGYREPSECETCDGTGRVPEEPQRPTELAEGRRPFEEECLTCEGLGTRRFNANYITCEECDGQGLTPLAGPVNINNEERCVHTPLEPCCACGGCDVPRPISERRFECVHCGRTFATQDDAHIVRGAPDEVICRSCYEARQVVEEEDPRTTEEALTIDEDIFWENPL